ncbi:MAG: DUF1552 domain-containing protein [Deltaproteobacteria bacterium]|nr:DUF1552 domain-containing protein [Deltaproteobacteria bacterium]
MNVLASRRSFLKAVGATAVTLPFFKLLEASAVQAATQPLRFIGVYHPHGKAKNYWSPKNGAAPGAISSSFDIGYDGAILKPFDDPATYGRSFKDKLLVLEGFSLVAAKESGTSAHGAASTILTAGANHGAATNPSIDYFLAYEKNLGADTRFRQVQVGCDYDGDPGWQLTFGPGGSIVPKMVNPVSTFNTLYADLIVGTDPVALAEYEKKRRRGQSVLDYLKGRLQSLDTRLAAAEKQKLDQHLTAVRELEKRLAGSPLSQMCQKPAKPVLPAGYPNYDGGNYATWDYNDFIMDAHIELLAQALACDLTRFSTLYLGDAGRPLTNVSPGVPSNVHDDAAHSCWGPDDATPQQIDEAQRRLANANRYHYGKIAKLATRLHDLDVFDHTLMFVASDIGDPAGHTTHDIPMLMLGGCNGKIPMGRHVRTVYDCPGDAFCSNPKYTPHNALLVNIANAFDVPITSYGISTKPATTAGPYPGLA